MMDMQAQSSEQDILNDKIKEIELANLRKFRNHLYRAYRLGKTNDDAPPFGEWFETNFGTDKPQPKTGLSDKFFQSFGGWSVNNDCKINDLPFTYDIRRFLNEYDNAQYDMLMRIGDTLVELLEDITREVDT